MPKTMHLIWPIEDADRTTDIQSELLIHGFTSKTITDPAEFLQHADQGYIGIHCHYTGEAATETETLTRLLGALDDINEKMDIECLLGIDEQEFPEFASYMDGTQPVETFARTLH